MKTILAFVLAFTFFSCGNSAEEKKSTDPNYNSSLEKVENGMTLQEAEEITGKPASVEDLGKSESETGDTSHLIQWYFGTNQSVMFENGKVVSVELDIKASQEKLQRIMDSAKAADGTTGGMIQQQPQ